MKIKLEIQQGYTLIELMIALALGLLITAAAIQLFITGQSSVNLQKGMADLQDSGNFGLRYLTREVRKANFNNVNIINDRLAKGGVVLTSRKTPAFASAATGYAATTIPVNLPNTLVDDIPVTAALINDSNVNYKSDQLVIQFYANTAGVDCEGNHYTSGRYIVERFFLRIDENKLANEPNKVLALACEAGFYTDSATKILSNGASNRQFGTTNGAILIRRVDSLRFLLGVSDNDATRNLRYMPIDSYLSLNQSPRPRINSIQVGMLVRSSESVNSSIDSLEKFQILDQQVKISKPIAASPKYLRQVVTQTIALRNGLPSDDVEEI